jgi:hypothetical protein
VRRLLDEEMPTMQWRVSSSLSVPELLQLFTDSGKPVHVDTLVRYPRGRAGFQRNAPQPQKKR